MRKIINGVEYDTDKASVNKKFTYRSPGDATGYEETLFITDNGKYFIYTNGGTKSKYPTENITPIEREQVLGWVMSH